jgi:CRISPR-associated protein Cmx8
MSKTQKPNLVTLEYQLHQLPSSQHRSGLAGLILKIQWLQQQEAFKDSVDTVCKVIHVDADKATLKFNLAGLTALFRSHYSASFVEREQLKPRTKGSQNFRIIQREFYDADTDRSTLTDIYIYQDIVPQGHLVQSFDPTANDSQIWTKLWQEATWGILRPGDRQRIPFKAMVSGADPPEIAKIWKLLLDSAEPGLSERPDADVPLSSTYMLGVQSKNNEGMPMGDRARFFFLLHFWSYVAQIYLPIHVDAKDKVTLYGYAIAIPDVRNLALFCQHLPIVLKQRSTKIKWRKPEAAIVYHPIEAGLSLLSHIQTYLGRNTSNTDINDLIFGIDVFHLYRKKHEAQILSIKNYLPDKDTIEEFTRIDSQILNSTFRIQYWQNLINHRPRITGFDTLLRNLPFAETIGNRWFCRDFRTLFYPQSDPMNPEETDAEQATSEPDVEEPSPRKEMSLAILVLRLLKNYTRYKLNHQFGIEWNKEWSDQKSDVRNQDPAYQAYKHRKELVLKDLHIDFRRHRHPNEFLDYFATKFTGVYQYLSTEEYLFLAEQIQSQPELIQNLCLLALPAL